MSLSTRILISLVLGVVAGLFVGEPLGVLEIVGEGYIRLLQMTVLPYVVVSLMAGLGSLELATARRLGLAVGCLLLLLWVLSFGMVAAMPFSFPRIESASFFSTTLIERPPAIDFLGLYIPSNPFHAMANNVVPAVVLFSLAVGTALISVPEKRPLLKGFHALSEALLRVNGYVVKLSPYGVFAIAASVSGTMSVEQFQRVQVYLVSYVLFSLIATYWVLPGLLAALTPIRHREALVVTRDAMVTAFATGSSFVVIPMLSKACKQILEHYAPENGEAESLVDVIVPASHTFPHAAKILSLSFVLFAGWVMDTPVNVSDYPLLFVSGIASTFGSVMVAIPFLLDLMHLPHDLMQLFVATGLVNSRFGTLLQAMHVLVITLLGASALLGLLEVRWKPVARYLGLTFLIVFIAIAGCRILFAELIDTAYAKGELVGNMHLILDSAPSIVYREPPPTPTLDEGRSRLDVILERGIMRSCYRKIPSLPFSYFNNEEQLVGFDIDMAHSLARGLGVGIHFVPVDINLGQAGQSKFLNSGYCDIVMSHSIVSMATVNAVVFSEAYLDLNVGFVVADHRRQEFAIREEIEEREGLRIAIPNDRYFIDRIQKFFPNAEFFPVLDTEEFLQDEGVRFDALILTAEGGSALSLLHPQYSVVVPDPPLQTLPAVYTLPLNEGEWRRVVDSWVGLSRGDGTVNELYDYWILGREAEHEKARWSILRNVLGWID